MFIFCNQLLPALKILVHSANPIFYTSYVFHCLNGINRFKSCNHWLPTKHPSIFTWRLPPPPSNMCDLYLLPIWSLSFFLQNFSIESPDMNDTTNMCKALWCLCMHPIAIYSQPSQKLIVCSTNHINNSKVPRRLML